MKRRRYREKNFHTTVGIRKGERVHDFLKGWGTICKDGSVLWDTWRPPTKKQVAKFKSSNFDKWTFPVIKSMMPTLLSSEIVGVQPMQ